MKVVLDADGRSLDIRLVRLDIPRQADYQVLGILGYLVVLDGFQLQRRLSSGLDVGGILQAVC